MKGDKTNDPSTAILSHSYVQRVCKGKCNFEVYYYGAVNGQLKYIEGGGSTLTRRVALFMCLPGKLV